VGELRVHNDAPFFASRQLVTKQCVKHSERRQIALLSGSQMPHEIGFGGIEVK
jgi:hypothetical protein